METHARYVLIGGAVLVAFAGLLGFAVWLAQIGLERDIRSYDIYFSGSVSGLGKGGDVTYRGIKVGEVKKLAIHPQDPSRVRVTVEIANTPIRKGDHATLQLQGITGVTFINIEGATAADESLAATAGEPLPVIPSEPSPFEALMAEAPDLFTKASLLLDRLGGVVNDENRAAFAQILAETGSAIKDLNQRGDQVGLLLDTLNSSRDDITTTIASLRSAAESFEGVAQDTRLTLEKSRQALGDVQQVVTVDVRDTLAEYRDAATSLKTTLDTLEGAVGENRDSLARFTREGLPELTALAAETRQLVTRLAALSDRLESQGAGALWVPRSSEVEVPR